MDITDSNFPKSLSPNISLQIASATNLPETWTCHFDFVHQRFLRAALVKAEWPTVLSEIMRVLKPGGHLQLVEGHSTDTIKGGPAFAQLMEIHETLLERRGMLVHCTSLLPNMLKDMGFVGIESIKKYAPVGKIEGQLGQTGAEMMDSVFEKTLPALLESGIITSVDEYNELLKAFRRESEGPELSFVAYWMFCARKPN